jgi:hypothetical protein
LTIDRTPQRVMLNAHYPAKKYPKHLRRIRFKDHESGKMLVSLINSTALPVLTIYTPCEGR